MNLLDRFDEYVIHKIFLYLEDDLYVMNSLMLIGPRYKRLIHKHLYKNQGFSDHIIAKPNYYDDRVILDPKNKRANLKKITSERDIVFINMAELMKKETLEERRIAHHDCHDIDINNPLESFSSSSNRPSFSVVLKDYIMQIDERDSQSRYYPIPSNNLGTIIQDESIHESIKESYESQLTKYVNKREETLPNEISSSRKSIYRDMYVGTGPFTIKSNDPL